MTTSATDTRPLARTVHVDDDTLTVGLADGRTITVPILWFPRLAHASPETRNAWELLGDGDGIHWPDADEDIGIEGLLAGYRPR